LAINSRDFSRQANIIKEKSLLELLEQAECIILTIKELLRAFGFAYEFAAEGAPTPFLIGVFMASSACSQERAVA
jgi:hypothetical protein